MGGVLIRLGKNAPGIHDSPLLFSWCLFTCLVFISFILIMYHYEAEVAYIPASRTNRRQDKLISSIE